MAIDPRWTARRLLLGPGHIHSLGVQVESPIMQGFVATDALKDQGAPEAQAHTPRRQRVPVRVMHGSGHKYK